RVRLRRRSRRRVPLQRVQRRLRALPRRRRLPVRRDLRRAPARPPGADAGDGPARSLDAADSPRGGPGGALEPAYPPQWGLTPECTEFLLKKPGAVNEEPRFADFVARHTTACLGGTTPPAEH